MLLGIISSQMMTTSGAEPFFGSDFILSTDWDRAYSASALYDSVADRTYIAWQMSDLNFSDRKGVRITSYDHSTGEWAAPVTVGNFVLANDSHGVPTLAQDADGYIYCFFGSHSSGQQWSISASPRDIGAWVVQTNFSGANTYAHVELVGSTLYYFARNDAVLSRRPLILRTGTPSGGSVSFSSAATIVDFGADSRFYIGETHVRGTDIHIIATRSNVADTARRGVYYFVYDTTNGSVRNFSGTTTVLAGSLPVDLTSANSNFRLYDHGANDGDTPSLNFDPLGNPHIIFADGISPTYDLKHLYHNGSAWTTPVTIASLSDVSPFGYVSAYTVAPSDSNMWAIYSSGGDMKRRVFSGGVWGPQANIARKSTRDYLYNSWVKNASSDIRIIFSERSPWSSDADAQPTKLFAFGDSGGRLGRISISAADPDWSLTRLLLGFNSRNNTTSIIDEGPATFSVASVNGNARIDTAQYRFGVSSLYLDGNGDWVTFPNSTSWTMSPGDITAEAFIRLNATGADQVILSRRPIAAGTNSEWQFLVNSANRLQLVAWSSTGAIVLNITGTTALASGAWYHVAFSRASTTTRIFLNGVLEDSGVESASVGSNSRPLTIGRDPTAIPRYFNGWIDELRITRSARYTSAFTPPSAPFVRGF